MAAAAGDTGGAAEAEEGIWAAIASVHCFAEVLLSLGTLSTMFRLLALPALPTLSTKVASPCKRIAVMQLSHGELKRNLGCGRRTSCVSGLNASKHSSCHMCCNRGC